MVQLAEAAAKRALADALALETQRREADAEAAAHEAAAVEEERKAAALAETHRVPLSGHVAPEFHLHLLAAVPHGEILEYMPRSSAILKAMPEPVNGVLTAPNGPGHGLALDETAVKKYRVG